MTGEIHLTVIGNLTNDPELRYTPSGAAVVNFTVASTPRTYNRTDQQWEDGETTFMRCSLWRQAAENAAESLRRGDRVVVDGLLKTRKYDTREGEPRTAIELEVEELAASVRYATLKVTRNPRSGAPGGGQAPGGGWQDQPAGSPQQAQQSGPPSDPWAGTQPTY